MAFSSLRSMGDTDRITPEICFTSDYPIKTLPFPIPQALQAEAKKQLKEMEAAGIIEKNIATWACPMFLVKKEGRRWQTAISDGSGFTSCKYCYSKFSLPTSKSIVINQRIGQLYLLHCFGYAIGLPSAGAARTSKRPAFLHNSMGNF